MHIIIGLVVFSAAAVKAQMVRQCLCDEIHACLRANPDGSIQQCADRCQSHISATGASYPAVRQCVLAHQGKLRAASSCVQSAYHNSCANAAGQVVPQRNHASIQSSAIREITSMLKRSGVLMEAAPLLTAGRNIGGCISQCAQANSCTRLGCGLSLPSDAMLVRTSKRCAIQAGFNTATAREICSCLANAGIRQLAPLCGRLIVS